MTLRLFFSICIFFIGFNTVASAQDALKTGGFIIKSTPGQILGSKAAEFNEMIGEDEVISWEVYVPESYDADNPPGIMILTGAPQTFQPPAGWAGVMEEKNLIWAVALKSGNAASIYQRQLLAIMSVPLIEKRYNINSNRIYVTGEGRVSSMVAMNNPKIIKGAILSGNLIWSDDAMSKVDAAKDNRFVFVTREKSIFPRGAREAHNRFKKAGAKNTKLQYIARSHRYNPSRFIKSIEYLDQSD